MTDLKFGGLSLYDKNTKFLTFKVSSKKCYIFIPTNCEKISVIFSIKKSTNRSHFDYFESYSYAQAYPNSDYFVYDFYDIILNYNIEFKHIIKLIDHCKSINFEDKIIDDLNEQIKCQKNITVLDLVGNKIFDYCFHWRFSKFARIYIELTKPNDIEIERIN